MSTPLSAPIHSNRQDVPHPRTTTATYIKWIAAYSDSKTSSLCLASKPALGGRPPFCGASRRFIVPSRACTNSALPSGRPVWVHRRISVSLDSVSPAARYCRQALAVQLFRHSSKSKTSFRASAPQCAAALDDSGRKVPHAWESASVYHWVTFRLSPTAHSRPPQPVPQPVRHSLDGTACVRTAGAACCFRRSNRCTAVELVWTVSVT
jgi:hypothetical protein